ncbi:hypothetical protein [Cytobacillus oceanisediminis]
MEDRTSQLLEFLNLLIKDDNPRNYPLKESVENEIAKTLDVKPL